MTLVHELKEFPGKNIFLVGGAEVVHGLMKQNLVDEYIISIIPVFVGNGIRLFKDDRPEEPLELISNRQYDTGLVQLHYRQNRR